MNEFSPYGWENTCPCHIAAHAGNCSGVSPTQIVDLGCEFNTGHHIRLIAKLHVIPHSRSLPTKLKPALNRQHPTDNGVVSCGDDAYVRV